MKGIARFSLGTLSFLILAFATCAQTKDLSGRWTTTSDPIGGRNVPAMNIRVSDKQVTGTFTSRDGVDMPIQNGKLVGNQIIFDAFTESDGQRLNFHFVGDVGTEMIALHCDLEGQGTSPTMIFHWNETPKSDDPPNSPSLANAPTPYCPLSAREKFEGSVGRLIRPTTLVSMGLGAGVSQLQDAPSHWGQGAAGFGRRFGMFYGYAAFRQSVLFAGTALTHEDPRPLRSERHGFLPRTTDALKLALQTRRDDGSFGFAWARTVADMGTGTLVMATYPGQHITGRSTLNLGLAYFGGREVSSVFSEFEPDVAKALHIDGVMRKLHLQKE